MSEKGKEDLALSIWNDMWSVIEGFARNSDFDYEMANVFRNLQKQQKVSFKELYSIDFYEVVKDRVVAEINSMRREAMLYWLDTFGEVLDESKDDRSEYSNEIIKYLEEQLKDPEFLPFLYSSVDSKWEDLTRHPVLNLDSYYMNIVNKIKNMI